MNKIISLLLICLFSASCQGETAQKILDNEAHNCELDYIAPSLYRPRAELDCVFRINESGSVEEYQTCYCMSQNVIYKYIKFPGGYPMGTEIVKPRVLENGKN